MNVRINLVKKIIASQLGGWDEGDITLKRQQQEKAARLSRKLPLDLETEPVSANGVPATWFIPPGAARGTMLYLHGGAFTIGSVDTHRELLGRLAKTTGRRILAIEYRLAPEHPFPAALEDALASFRWLLEQGHESRELILAGDSAGGGLALSAVLALRDTKEPLPAAVVCLSPWADLALEGSSIESRAEADIILSSGGLRRMAVLYAGGRDLKSPQLSPVYADFHGLPPLLLQVGEDEILHDDCIRVAAKARDAGVQVTLEIYPQMFHVFHMVPFLAQTREALNSIRLFSDRWS